MFHPTLSKAGRILFSPIIRASEYLGIHHPVLLVQIRHLLCYKRFANLKNPRNLNEKILYLKLFSDTSSWVDLADKYKVRDYVKKVGLGNILVELFGHWDSVEDFKNGFESLPNSFILKANNGDGKGSYVIVNEKLEFTGEQFNTLCATVRNWLGNKHVGALGAEPHYRKIKPCIIAEELLPSVKGETSPTDFKIWCFNGEPYFIWVCNDRCNHGSSAHVMTYDTDWVAHPEYQKFNSDYLEGAVMPKPENLDEMLVVARRLSAGFPEVRVDLYNIDNKIYFGELTFTSFGGLNTDKAQEFLNLCGELVKIPGSP